MEIYAALYRRAEADSDDFSTISLHMTRAGARAAVEGDAADIWPHHAKVWRRQPDGTEWFVVQDDDGDDSEEIDVPLWSVEKQTVLA